MDSKHPEYFHQLKSSADCDLPEGFKGDQLHSSVLYRSDNGGQLKIPRRQIRRNSHTMSKVDKHMVNPPLSHFV